jgi:hypothetical protein
MADRVRRRLPATVEELIADYEQARRQSRQRATRFDLEDLIPHPRLGRSAFDGSTSI